jgi:hypothetical protein
MITLAVLDDSLTWMIIRLQRNLTPIYYKSERFWPYNTTPVTIDT